MFVDDRQKSPDLFPVIEIAGGQRLHKPLDSRQRRLDLMGNGGGKITPHVLQAPQLSHVADDYQSPQPLLQGIYQRSTVHIEGPLPVLVVNDIRFKALTGGQRLVHQFLERMVADDLKDAAPLNRRHGHTEHPGGGRIDTDDPLLHVRGNNPFAHTGKHRLGLLALAGNLIQPLLKLFGHLVHGGRQPGKLERIRKRNAVKEVARGKPIGPVTHAFDGRGDSFGNEPADPRRQQRHQQRTDGHAKADGADALVDGGHGDGGPQHTGQAVFHDQRQGHVHHLLLQRVAVADAHPHLAQVGITDFLTIKMAGHPGRCFFGIPNHPPIGQDHRHPGDRATGGILAEAVHGRCIQRRKQAEHLSLQKPAVDLKISLGALQVKVAGKAQCIPAHRKQRNQRNEQIGRKELINPFFFYSSSVFHEPVPNPPNRFNIMPQRSQLLSQAHDLHVHAAIGNRVVVAAHGIHDLGAGKDPARATGENIKDLELRIGQV